MTQIVVGNGFSFSGSAFDPEISFGDLKSDLLIDGEETAHGAHPSPCRRNTKMLFITRLVMIGLLSVGITAATTAQAGNQMFTAEWYTESCG
jgi:hypothetical protein